MMRWICLFSQLLLLAAAQAATIDSSVDFTPADSSRDTPTASTPYMDRAGVWNGSSDVRNSTGDTFSLTLSNSGATAYDLGVTVTLPAGFTYVPGTASASGASVSASQSGTTLTISLDSGEYDLANGSSITIDYGLRAEASVAAGTYSLGYQWSYGDAETPTSTTTGSTAQNALVFAGASVLEKFPASQTVGVGETATWTVTVTNSGYGGLFDVEIDERDLLGNSSFGTVSISQTSPATTATQSPTGLYTLPYLAPGEDFTLEVTAVVVGCDNLGNTASTTDRTGLTAASREGSVVLDFDLPIVDLTTNAISLDFLTPTSVSIPISNVAGTGPAVGFVLDSNLNNLGVVVSNVGGGFSYNASNGQFTYTANGGNIDAATTATLTFDVVSSDVCAGTGGGTIVWQAFYDNECGDPYAVPFDISSISAPANNPSVSVSASDGGESRLSNNETGTFTVVASGTELSSIASDPVTVDIEVNGYVSITSAPGLSAGSVADNGDGTYTWSFPRSSLSSNPTATLAYQVDSDPCLGGTHAGIVATIEVDTVNSASGAPCTISDSASDSFTITNNPGAQIQQYYNITGNVFETGAASADDTRDSGEGEFIPHTAIYSFDASYPGEWIGSTYTDDFGGDANQTLVPGSLMVTFSDGTTTSGPVPVPTDAATLAQSTGELRINLDFLAGDSYIGRNAVGDAMVTFDYETTVPDASLGSGSSAGYTNLVVLRLQAPTTGVGACASMGDSIFTQVDSYSVQRAAASLSVNLPNQLEVCEEFDAVITVGNANNQEISRVLTTLLTSNPDYTYITGQTPVYGGAFDSGNIVYSENGGSNPTFRYTGTELSGSGTITVRMLRSASSGTDTSSLSARVAYDDEQTYPTTSRDFSTTAAGSPGFVFTAELAATVTPNPRIQLSDTRAQWSIIVQNLQPGTAYDAQAVNQLPPYFQIDSSATAAANSVGFTVSGSSTSGQTITFDLGDVAGGDAETLTVVADLVPGSSCAIPDDQNTVTVTWGCGTAAQTINKLAPNFRLGSGDLQVVHNTTNSVARLCSNGEVEILVRNSGSGAIYNVVALEEMDASITGLSIIPGSVSYATDNNPGSFTTVGGLPTGTGSSSNPYRFDSSLIPELDHLVAVHDDDGSTVNSLTIRFLIEASDPNVFAGNNPGPSLTAEGSAELFCGSNVPSPGIPFVIPTEKPDISTSLTIENTEVNDGYGEVEYGVPGDVVAWRFVISNDGVAAAENVRVRIPLSGSNGSAVLSGDVTSPGATYSGGWFAADTVLPGSSIEVTVLETLGSDCADKLSTAEVTWGCDTPSANSPNLVSQPSDNDDTAQIIMLPNFVDNGGTMTASFDNSLTSSPSRGSNSRARIRVTMTNSGAVANTVSVTPDLPVNTVLDTTTAPVFVSNSSSLTTVAWDSVSTSDPKFEFTGTMEHGESFTMEFYVISTIDDTTRASTFPNLADEEETGNGLDPSISLGGNNRNISADFKSACGADLNRTITLNIDPRQPDLDIKFAANGGSPSSTVLNRIVFAGQQETFDVYIRNEGESGSSATDNSVTITLGAGWASASAAIVSTPRGSGGSGSASGNTFTFTAAQVGELRRSGSSYDEVHLRIIATPTGAPGDSLSVQAEVDSPQHATDGTTTGRYISQDSRGFRCLGVTVAKTYVTGSTTEGDSTVDGDTLIGEEAAFDLAVGFFGAETGADISNLVVRDTLGDSAAADKGLGLVSIDTSSSELTPTSVTTTPTGLDSTDPVQNGVIDFNLGTITGPIGSGNNEFTARIVTRTLNDTGLSAVNSDNKTLYNHVGVSLSYLGQVFRSSETVDAFSGGIGYAELHSSASLRVQRPTMSVDKQVRNITAGGSFGNTAEGEATDVFEFRTVITNTDATAVTVPLYDIAFTDTIPGRFDLLDGSSSPAFAPGADTTGDGAVDVAMTGGIVAGSGGSLTINATNLNLSDPGRDLTELAPGESITILYRAQAALSVNPSQQLTDPVTVSADTLPGTSGSQSARTGSTGDSDGAAELTASDSPGVTITINSIDQAKIVSTTSVGNDDSRTVLIGEQVEFEVSLVLPQGTAPSLVVNDSLPVGLELVAIDAPIIGSGVTTGSTTTPTVSLPTHGSPLDLEWDFGNTTVVSGSGDPQVNRTITLRYTAQVRNIASNQHASTLTNKASYSLSGTPMEIADVELTLHEAQMTVTKQVDTTDPVDAGDTLTFTVTVENAGGGAAAYELDLQDTLPDGLTYEPGSTTLLSGSGETQNLTGTLAEPDDNAGVLTWGRTQSSPVNLDLATGGRLVFTYRATVDDAVQPEQDLDNDVLVTWTSLDGDPGPDLGDVTMDTAGSSNGERTGDASGANDNRATASANVVSAKSSVVSSKTASGDTLPLSSPASGFRVGDVVTYTLEVTLMEGTQDDFEIRDDLPAGMEFVGFDAITPASDNDGITYTAPVAGTTAPEAGDTGTIAFQLGTVVNEGDAQTDNDMLTLVYRVRIVDDVDLDAPDGLAGTSADRNTNLVNSARAAFHLAGYDPSDDLHETAATSDTVILRQPELIADKQLLLPSSGNDLVPEESGRFEFTITNQGTAPAYDAVIVDTLPVGLRQTTPTLQTATLAGNDILGDLAYTYSAATGELTLTLTDAQRFDPGDSLVVSYDFTVDPAVQGNQTIHNSVDVTEHYSQPSTSTDGRRKYDNVVPATEPVDIAITVQGFVFEDVNGNRGRSYGETWATGSTVYVNLVQGGSVIDSYRVDPGAGDFRFDRVPSGNYELVITDSASKTTAVAPSGFIFYEALPSDGRLPLTVANDSLYDVPLGLRRGTVISGRVIRDDGEGGGTANDGSLNGGEVGLGNVVVRLTDCGSTVYNEALTHGDGSFELVVPPSVANGATLCIEQYNLSEYVSTGGDAGDTGGSYDRSADAVTFTYAQSESRSGVLFFDVPPNALLTDGEQTILPGNVAFYSHTFMAGTGGEVVFSLGNALNPNYPGWGQTLFRDTNCNGVLDAGEPQISLPGTPISVNAGDVICLIVKDASPSGAPYGSTNQITLTATFTYTDASPSLPGNVLTRQDLTRIGPGTTAGLELVKAVDTSSASPGAVITYTITFENKGEDPLNEIVVFDRTPAYTTFVSAAATTPLPDALTGVSITEPTPGEAGSIIWTFTGTLDPGAQGEVTYQVQIDN